MAIDGEPKDGDFVRYIEMLNRQAGGSPGHVPPRQPRQPREARRRQPAAAPVPAPAAPDPAVPDDKPAPTLAARSGQRRIALGLTIAGLVAAWHAARLFGAALEQRPVEIDELIPAIFLAVCAFMLFKGGSRLRAAQRKPLPVLPPLSTLPGGRNRST